MDNYFKLLKDTYDQYDFADNPECIFNMDETGMPLCPRPPKVIARKGQKKVRYRTSGQKSQVTSGSATGQVIPPFIIFSGKQVSPLWTQSEVNGSRFTVSNNGWIDQELFNFWLTDHFLPNAPSHRPSSSYSMGIVPTLNLILFSLQGNMKLSFFASLLIPHMNASP